MSELFLLLCVLIIVLHSEGITLERYLNNRLLKIGTEMKVAKSKYTVEQIKNEAMKTRKKFQRIVRKNSLATQVISAQGLLNYTAKVLFLCTIIKELKKKLAEEDKFTPPSEDQIPY
jgi:hypothetical protein